MTERKVVAEQQGGSEVMGATMGGSDGRGAESRQCAHDTCL